jgi:hypothetical protein
MRIEKKLNVFTESLGEGGGVEKEVAESFKASSCSIGVLLHLLYRNPILTDDLLPSLLCPVLLNLLRRCLRWKPTSSSWNLTATSCFKLSERLMLLEADSTT